MAVGGGGGGELTFNLCCYRHRLDCLLPLKKKERKKERKEKEGKEINLSFYLSLSLCAEIPSLPRQL